MNFTQFSEEAKNVVMYIRQVMLQHKSQKWLPGTVKRIIYIIILAFSLFNISGCNLNNADGGEEELEPQTFSLSAEVSPSEGGSVDPSSGSFEEKSEVTVEATPSDGWSFNGWTGDIESQDNPLTFAIDQNTSLTANFVDTRSTYSVGMTLTGSEGEVDGLEFGQSENPYSEDAPPSPPEGALHAYFTKDNEEMFKDYRSHVNQEVNWQLHYQAHDGEELALSWQIDAQRIEGSLTLTIPDGSFEVDMKSDNSFVFDQGAYEYFEIRYRFEE